MWIMLTHCTPADQDRSNPFSQDERYLINRYVELTEARDLHDVSAFKSDSLFARLDSTIDSARIANTIQRLNEKPDRWLDVFSEIERRLNTSEQGDS